MVEDITFQKEDELRAYRTMVLIRRFEEKAGQLYALGSVEGLCPLSIGQEGSITGALMAAEQTDPIVTAHRNHGHMLARGIAPDAIFAELLGRETGLAGGAGGACRMAAPSVGFYGGYTTPGLTAPIGTGLAFAAKARGTKAVALTFFGDGAAGNGAVEEALRLAGTLKLPVLFIIDNNAHSSDAEDEVGRRALSAIGEPFGIPGIEVDGIDVRKARAAVRKAIAHARDGHGATIIEMATYRYRGHGGVPSRASSGEKRREDQDPIEKARRRILDDRLATEAQLKALEKEIRDSITAAAQRAKAARSPDVARWLASGSADRAEARA